VTSRCNRCGRASEGSLCQACQTIVAELRAKELSQQHLGAERRAVLKKPERGYGSPPAVVIRTSEPVGHFQLHHLRERARFYCETCRQHKTAALVATVKGDWKHMLCNACYSGQVKAQRRTAKRTAQPGSDRVQARQKQSRKRLKQLQAKRMNGGPAKPKAAKAEHRLLTPRRSGMERLLAFFRAAGLNAVPGRGGCLWINGSQTGPLAQVPSPETADWINLVNEIAVKYARDKFTEVVEGNACFGEGLTASLVPSSKGFAIMRGEDRLAIIHAAHASIVNRPFIYANFLTPGPHWQHAAEVLSHAEAELVGARKRNEEGAAQAAEAAANTSGTRAAWRRRIDQLPRDVAPGLIDACLAASRRIRLERRVAYDHPVVLESDIGELTLLPITGTLTRLLLPFHLSRGSELLKGELILEDHDPLPLLISQNVADEDAITAWACALTGFADATCIEFGVAARPRPTTQRRRPSSVSRRSPATRTLPRKQRWPEHLEPKGQWVRYSSSFVVGHRRHLHDGQTASDEARDWARQVGIILGPQETWVRPYVRGIPDGMHLRFWWHAPGALRRFRT
jgi:hypothetical protein